MSEKMNELYAALAAFQAELPHVGKDGTNPHFRSQYATLEDVSRVVLPRLAKHGLSFTAAPTVVDEDAHLVMVRGVILHKSGGSIVGVFPFTGSNPQQYGSSLTYARRYLLCSMTGVAPGGEDDDGNAASEPPAWLTPRPDDGKFLALITGINTQEGLRRLAQDAQAAGAYSDRLRDALNERLEVIRGDS